jgi:hypothetical protein
MFENLFSSQALLSHVAMFLVGGASFAVFVHLRRLKARLRQNEAEFQAFEAELMRARSLVRMTGMLIPVNILIRGDHEIALICAPVGFKGNIEVQKKQNANG